MSAIGGLSCLAKCIRPDNALATNLFSRYIYSPIHMHWNGIKHILCYLQDTVDVELIYPRNSEFGMVGFEDAWYLWDPHKTRLRTIYVFYN